MNKHRIVRLILVFFIGILLTGQVFPQILKRDQVKRQPGPKPGQLLVQSNMFVNSDTNELTIHF